MYMPKQTKEEKPEKKKCVICGKTLRAIGDRRANGKNHKDWDGRTKHKQCWKNE